MAWPVHYRLPEAERLATLRQARRARRSPRWSTRTSPAWRRWLTEWVTGVRRATPRAPCRPRRSSPSRTSPTTWARRSTAGARVREGARAGRRLRPARPAAAPGVGAARRGGRARDRALRQRAAARRAHRPRRVRRGAARPTRGCRRCSPTPGMPDFGAALDLRRTATRACHLDTTMVGAPFSRGVRPAAAATGPRGSPTSPTASCSAPTSRTSPTPTPSSCGRRGVGGRRRPARRRRSCARCCTTPRPGSWGSCR